MTNDVWKPTQQIEAYKEAVGCDEVGRGCLAGPVVAAAVFLPLTYPFSPMKDSKQLKPRQRMVLAAEIRCHALWGIGMASVAEIDAHNILQATFLAMHRAIAALAQKHAIPLLLIDGSRFAPYLGIPHQCVVKGDRYIPAIAAASILAKTHRDALMEKLGAQYPAYGWHANKGYPSEKHRLAIRQQGITPHHRLTFKGVSGVKAPCED